MIGNMKENVEKTYRISEYTKIHKFLKTHFNIFVLYITNTSL